MKKIMLFAAMLLFLSASTICFAKTLPNENARQAVYDALNQASSAIASAPFGKKTVAIMPVEAGNEVLYGKLQNIVTGAGFSCIIGKNDPMFDEIIKEITWDERKEDILDPQTIVKFGKLKSAQILLQCIIRTIDQTDERIYAEIELHAYDIATAEHIWGDSFVSRFYLNDSLHGIITLDNNLRMLLKKNFAEAAKSMTSPIFAEKLSKVKTVMLVPICGDIGGYLNGLAVEMLSNTSFYPQTPRIPTLSAVRATARDGKLNVDAVMYGSLRDLRSDEPSESVDKKNKQIITSQTYYADLQLFIEDVKTGNILWSKTITLAETLGSSRDMTQEEIQEVLNEKIDNIKGDIKGDLADNWKSYVKTILWILGGIFGGIILLILLIVGIKAAISFRNVR